MLETADDSAEFLFAFSAPVLRLLRLAIFSSG